MKKKVVAKKKSAKVKVKATAKVALKKKKKALPKIVHSFVIEEAKWHHGADEDINNPIESALRMPRTGKMCCLGFFCESLGVPAKKMIGQSTPDCLTAPRIASMKKLPELLVQLAMDVDGDGSIHDKSIIGDLTDVNDSACDANNDGYTTHAGRRKLITKLFRSMGVRVTYK